MVRYQGGHNAGHTLVIGNVTYKLSLLPSGVVRPGKLAIIGNGVVVDPWALGDEINRLGKQGVKISRENLRIAENATLILPLHRELDQMREAAAGDGKIGTTGRGIGPAYEDKVGRRAIRVQDLKNLGTLGPKVDRILVHHNALRRGLGQPEVSKDALMAELIEVAPKILPYMDVTWDVLDRARKSAKRILFEGAQGALLDVDHGTYPFVTSSNTVAAQAATGSGVGPGALGYVLGIAKAYTTRVGSGPFPTELTDDIGELIGRKGHEFGVVTGRKRRCGWFDAVPRAADHQGHRHRRHRADQARRARRLRRDQGLRRLHARRRAHRPAARPATMRRPACSRSTRPSRAGRNRRAAPAAGASCRRRR